jgi:hypothetical protein
MNELLTRILDVQGGMDRWNRYEKIEAAIVSGGGFFALKGVVQDSNPRRMTVWLHEERSSVLPYGAPASLVGFFHGTFQPHLDQMQHAPINNPTCHRL